MPFFTMLLLRLAGVERIGIGRACGLALSIGGVAVLMSPKVQAGATFGVLGGLAVLVASFSYGLGNVWARRLKDRPVLLTATCSLIASSAVAYILFYWIIGSAGPANATLVTFLVPANAIFLGAFVLGERLDWTAFAGLGLILHGLAVIDGRAFRWFARSRPVPAD